jgi:hypothetical protein
MTTDLRMCTLLLPTDRHTIEPTMGVYSGAVAEPTASGLIAEIAESGAKHADLLDEHRSDRSRRC